MTTLNSNSMFETIEAEEESAGGTLRDPESKFCSLVEVRTQIQEIKSRTLEMPCVAAHQKVGPMCLPVTSE